VVLFFVSIVNRWGWFGGIVIGFFLRRDFIGCVLTECVSLVICSIACLG